MNWYHNSYSEEAEEEMRAEAENRVQAMQERARRINEMFAPPEELRAEAENRAHIVQEQAKRISENFRQAERPSSPAQPSPQPFPQPPPRAPPMPSMNSMPPMPNFFSNLFPPARPSGGPALFGLNSDKLMILALIWILWRENCDIKLLLALLYLLL